MCCIFVLTYFAGVLATVCFKCAFAFTVLIFGVIALAYISFQVPSVLLSIVKLMYHLKYGVVHFNMCIIHM
jgi:hypothetical protein